jgi:lactoylglutathione lyase
MKIEHLAIWVRDLEKMKNFYVKYFQALSNEMYHNESKKFKSYFLRFDSGCRLELMSRPDIINETSQHFERQKIGIVHFAMSVGSKPRVDDLTNELRNDGYKIAGEPRTTGDGYYESVVLDPEGNIIEITI